LATIEEALDACGRHMGSSYARALDRLGVAASAAEARELRDDLATLGISSDKVRAVANEVEADAFPLDPAADRSQVMDLAVEAGLSNVESREPMPREGIPATLASVDECLVPLRDSETSGSVIPSAIPGPLPLAGRYCSELAGNHGRSWSDTDPELRSSRKASTTCCG